MRSVVQRVRRASVAVGGETVGAIDAGLVALLGVGVGDADEDADWMAEKTATLRIFKDGAGKMNRSVEDVQGSVLAVSQFTLYGDCSRGRRPGFERAEAPERARALYGRYVARLRDRGLAVAEGVFAAEMVVAIENDGPVTILLDSDDRGRGGGR